MITINLVVPYTDAEQIQNSDADDFRIRGRARNYNKPDSNVSWFLIETTEEQFTVLILKYGKDNVWKR